MDESKNNSELQILEFIIGKYSYGINALRVKQVIKFDAASVVPIPGANPSIIGSTIFQGNSIPIVNLAHFLGVDPVPDAKFRIVLICEFNRQVNGFLIDDIRNMMRVPTDAIQQRSFSAEQGSVRVSGIYPRDKGQILLLDFQDIITDLFGVRLTPGSAPAAQPVVQKQIGCVLAADDSSSTRKIISHLFDSAGITDYRLFENGQDLLTEFEVLLARAAKDGRKIRDLVRLIVTDIEMPRMDGLRLCREVKARSTEVPVIVLSSLVNSQMNQECQAVHADGCLSKEDLAELIPLIARCTAGPAAQ